MAAEVVLALVAGLARRSSKNGGCRDEEAGLVVRSGQWERAVRWWAGDNGQREQQQGC